MALNDRKRTEEQLQLAKLFARIEDVDRRKKLLTYADQLAAEERESNNTNTPSSK